MQVDTGAFQAVTDQLAALAERVERLEASDPVARGQHLAILDAVYDAGRQSARREVGLPADSAPRRPRHLRPVRGDR